MPKLERIHWRDNRANTFQFYGKEDEELYTCTDPTDALYDDILNDIPKEDLLEKLENNNSIEVFAFNKKEIKPEHLGSFEDFEQSFSENHDFDDPDGEEGPFTDEGWNVVKKAYDDFVQLFIKHYQVYQLDCVAVIEVPVRELYESMGPGEFRDSYFGEPNETT